MAGKHPKQPKKLVRWGQTRKLSVGPGTYFDMVPKKMALLLGQILVRWSHVEEQLMELMAILVGDFGHKVVRPLYQSIRGPEARIRTMKMLLESAIINKERSKEWDDTIQRYKELSDKRNVYVHALWRTHAETKDVYAFEPSASDIGIPMFGEKEKVKIQEGHLHAMLANIDLLSRMIHHLREKEDKKRAEDAAKPV